MELNVIVLGSGAATPTLSRHCSSQIVNIGGKKILIDCGESTQDQIRTNRQKLQSFSTIFISHLHGDHFFGLPGLVSTMHLCGRTEPLTIVAPRGAAQCLNLLFEISGSHIDFELIFVEMDFAEPTEVYSSNTFSVKAFPLRHSVPTYGFLFEEETQLLNLKPNVREEYHLSYGDCVRVKNGEDFVSSDGTVVPNSVLTQPRRFPRRYAYCCDTAYDESIVPIVAGVDLLCMESTFGSEFRELAEQRLHCTAAQAATLAAKAEVGQLMLTHFSARYKTTDKLLAEACAIFPNTICASDGAVYDIPFRYASR